MKISEQLSIFKNKEAQGNQPTHTLTFKSEETGKWVKVASFWYKEETGNFSGGLEKPYGDRPGFELVAIEGEATAPSTDINPEDSPF